MELNEEELKVTLNEIKEIKKDIKIFYDIANSIDSFLNDNIYFYEMLIKKELKRIIKEEKESDE